MVFQTLYTGKLDKIRFSTIRKPVMTTLVAKYESFSFNFKKLIAMTSFCLINLLPLVSQTCFSLKILLYDICVRLLLMLSLFVVFGCIVCIFLLTIKSWFGSLPKITKQCSIIKMTIIFISWHNYFTSLNVF